MGSTSDTQDTSDITAGEADRSVSATGLLRGAAVAGALVLGLTACGGGSEVAVDESPSTTAADSGFIMADEAPEDSAPEALAASEDEAEVVTDSDEASETIDEGVDVVEDADPVEDDEEQESTPIAVDSPPSPPEAEGNHAVFSNGQLFVRGTVPSEEMARAIVVASEQVLGAGNVIDEYEIDPESEFEPGQASTVYVADNILFETGSAEVTDASAPSLGLLPLLMAIQPDVTIWAYGHTDSVGSAESNLALSQARVDAVRAWVIERGGDPERFFATGEGETNPIADNDTDDGRAQNRRVEFVIDGFDIGLD